MFITKAWGQESYKITSTICKAINGLCTSNGNIHSFYDYENIGEILKDFIRIIK